MKQKQRNRKKLSFRRLEVSVKLQDTQTYLPGFLVLGPLRVLRHNFQSESNLELYKRDRTTTTWISVQGAQRSCLRHRCIRNDRVRTRFYSRQEPRIFVADTKGSMSRCFHLSASRWKHINYPCCVHFYASFRLLDGQQSPETKQSFRISSNTVILT